MNKNTNSVLTTVVPQTQAVATVTPSAPVPAVDTVTPSVPTPLSVIANFPTSIGCYTDQPDRAMTTWLSGQNPINYVTFDTCKERAIERGFKYFAMHDG